MMYYSDLAQLWTRSCSRQQASEQCAVKDTHSDVLEEPGRAEPQRSYEMHPPCPPPVPSMTLQSVILTPGRAPSSAGAGVRIHWTDRSLCRDSGSGVLLLLWGREGSEHFWRAEIIAVFLAISQSSLHYRPLKIILSTWLLRLIIMTSDDHLMTVWVSQQCRCS